VPISVRGENTRKRKKFSGGSEMKITRGMLLRMIAGVLITLQVGLMLWLFGRSDFPYSVWSFGFFFTMLMIGVRYLLSRRWKWLWRSRREKDQRRE
jgi:hypothetical protein